MAKTSLVERLNSWRPFLHEIHTAVHARDYRKKTIALILHMLDPELSLWPGSLWRYIKGNIIGNGFSSGRESLYKKPFEQFLARKGKLFKNAPLQVVQEFNSLIHALFPEPVASQLFINEKWALERQSKIEEALAQEEKTKQRIIEFSLAYSKELNKEIIKQEDRPIIFEKEVVPESAISSTKPSLFSSSSSLDETTKEIIETIIASPELSDKTKLVRYKQIIAVLEKGNRAFQLSRQNLLITLTSPRFLTFADLLKQAKELPVFMPEHQALKEWFQDLDVEKVTSRIDKRLSELEEPYPALIEIADNRTKIISEIKKETERLHDLIQPFVQKKELKEQAEILLNQISIIQIPPSIFTETNTAVVDSTIKKLTQKLQNVSTKVETQFREFIIQNRQLARSANFLKMLLFAARWELVSGATPYQDLHASFFRVRDQLTQIVEKNRHLLLIGKSTLAEYTLSIVNAIYETDVKLLRGELTARSLRLKDLRLAIQPQLQTTDRMVSLITLAGKLTKQSLTERQWLASFFYKLLSPYKIFKDTYDPESINRVFRYWWIDMERFLKGKESRYYTFLHNLEDSTSRLIRPLARTLDIIEKAGASSHRNVYQRFLDMIQHKTGAEAIGAIEQWLRDESTGITGMLVPQLALIPQIDQEPLIEQLLHIEERILEVIHFAKSIQAVKTFEPERIDSLLEVFSLFPFATSFDQSPLIRLQQQEAKMEATIQRVEEELVLELGLLDKKARMECGSAINNLLPQALLKVPSILTSLVGHLRLIQQHTDPYVSSIAHFLIDEAMALSSAFGEIGFSQEALFPAFQKLTVLLFHRTMLDNALQTKNFARILLLLTATAQIVERFRFMEAKGELSFAGTLIDELDALASSQWDIVDPSVLQKKSLYQKLQKFIGTARRIIVTSGLKERREAHLVTGIEKVSQELTEDMTYDIPKLSFVPGDLAYLWQEGE